MLINQHGFGTIEVKRSGQYIVQKRYNDGSVGTRVSWDNGQTWSKWKYLEANLVKTVDFGTLGNAENKGTNIGEEIQNITRMAGIAKNGNTIIPFPNNEIKIFIEGTWLNITTTTDMSAYNAIIRIYYEE